MNMQLISRTVRTGSVPLILAGLLSLATLASATTNKPAPPPPPAKPAAAAPAAKPAPAAQAPRPAGNPGGGSMQRPATGSPSVYRPSTSSPSVNRPTTSTPTYRPNGAGNPPATPNVPMGNPSPKVGPGGHIQPPVAKGTVDRKTASGSTMRMRPNGKPSDIHNAKTGMDIHHGLNGTNRVSVEDRNHTRTVFQKGRPGYVQHPFSFRQHEFAQRSYFYHGHAYNHLYYGYAYRGAFLDVYAPGFYYGPAFYGWAYNPWASPISYGWGFAGNPWSSYYGYYFAPSSSYPSASYWLTDYMISSDLQTAYDAHKDAGEVDGIPPAQSGPPILTPEVKQQIADEVNNDLALENQEAQKNTQNLEVDPGSSGIDRLLDDAAHGRQHVFVVGNPLDVVDTAQAECTLSDGDVLSLRAAPPPDSATVDLVVLTSKGAPECQMTLTVSVQLTDLQEMQNHMRETIDQGLKELQAKQGKGGLPVEPSTAKAAPVPAQYAALAPPPDPNAATEIQQQALQANQSEQDVTAEASQPGGAQ